MRTDNNVFIQDEADGCAGVILKLKTKKLINIPLHGLIPELGGCFLHSIIYWECIRALVFLLLRKQQ